MNASKKWQDDLHQKLHINNIEKQVEKLGCGSNSAQAAKARLQQPSNNAQITIHTPDVVPTTRIKSSFPTTVPHDLRCQYQVMLVVWDIEELIHQGKAKMDFETNRYLKVNMTRQELVAVMKHTSLKNWFYYAQASEREQRQVADILFARNWVAPTDRVVAGKGTKQPKADKTIKSKNQQNRQQ